MVSYMKAAITNIYRDVEFLTNFLFYVSILWIVMWISNLTHGITKEKSLQDKSLLLIMWHLGINFCLVIFFTATPESNKKSIYTMDAQ